MSRGPPCSQAVNPTTPPAAPCKNRRRVKDVITLKGYLITRHLLRSMPRQASHTPLHTKHLSVPILASLSHSVNDLGDLGCASPCGDAIAESIPFSGYPDPAARIDDELARLVAFFRRRLVCRDEGGVRMAEGMEMINGRGQESPARPILTAPMGAVVPRRR